jgi:hypothetical protein
VKRFFDPNIETKGRVMRAVTALLLFIASGVAFFRSTAWLGIALGLIGVFVAFEAVRGWCFLRACGIKTKL